MILDKRLIGWFLSRWRRPVVTSERSVQVPRSERASDLHHVKRETVGKNSPGEQEVSVCPGSGPHARRQSSAVSDPASARNENRRRILESELQNEPANYSPTPGRSSPSMERNSRRDERNYARVLDD